jgi:hypothetical protein
MDGIVTMNWASATPECYNALERPSGKPGRWVWAPVGHYGVPLAEQQAYHEIGDPDLIRYEDKIFAVSTRFGGGGGNWDYGWKHFNGTNVEGQLPAAVSGDDMPTILTLYVGDDLAANADRVAVLDLRILLSGAASTDEIEVKLNGVLLPPPGVVDGVWRFFAPTARQFAVGPNLIYIRAKRPMMVEKIETQPCYYRSD